MISSNLTQALFILFLPLVSFIYQIFFGKILGRNTHFISIGLISVVLYFSITFLKKSIGEGYGTILEVSSVWFESTDFSVYLGVFIDNITSIMLCVVALISFLVHFSIVL